MTSEGFGVFFRVFFFGGGGGGGERVHDKLQNLKKCVRRNDFLSIWCLYYFSFKEIAAQKPYIRCPNKRLQVCGAQLNQMKR